MNDINCRLKPGRKKKTKDNDVCMVCNGKSVGINFGVHTCSPCKAFFRRNAVKLGIYEFQCRGNGDCPVTSDTRRQCNCCRLAKCFRVGMDRNAIRTDDQRLERNRLVEANRVKRAQQKNNNDIVLTLETPDQKSLIRPCNLLIHSKVYTRYLSLKDSNILNNIYHSYERICLPFTFEEHVNMPIDENLTLDKFLNACANIYVALIQFFKSLPEFGHISIDGKLSLVKSNLNQVFRIHGAYLMKNITPDLCKDSPVYLCVFPEEIYAGIRDDSFQLAPFICDPILLKLFMIVLMLSTHLNTSFEHNCQDTLDKYSIRAILNVQNFYLELLWRFILSRSSSYHRSVQLITSFIGHTLTSQVLQANINDYICTVLPSRVQTLEPIIKSVWISNI